MPSSLENRVAIWAGLVAAIAIAVALGTVATTTRFQMLFDRVQHGHEIGQRLNELKSLVKDAESGQRGYMLSGGQKEYLITYDHAARQCDQAVVEIVTSIGLDSPERRQVLDELKPLIRQKFDEMNETIRLFKSGDPKAALALMQTGQGAALMVEIERIVKLADRSEKASLVALAREARIVRNLKWALSFSSATLTVGILFAVYLIVGREMWERERVEQELARTRDLAEAANRAKGDFMANVSHEIRTPMNAILGMTELTLDSDLAPHERENLEIVRSATESLLSIINDLLDFSKMEAGKLSLAIEDFDIRDQIATTMDLLALRAFDKELELACRINPAVPDRLVGDVSRLRQVIMNLVGNAIKFTSCGEVVVEVEAEPCLDGAIELQVRVTDSGIGIDPDKLEMIFAPFTQADGSTTRLYGGSGLGLSISAQLASLMGGRLWVESELGRGSTFHFTAKMGVSEACRPQEPASLASLRGLRVLVVDDNAVNRRIIGEMLTFWQMVPTLADSGLAALAEWERARVSGSPFSLVLLDALMPEMDGFSIARSIKKDIGLASNVILMLTSSDRQEFAETARLAGIDICLNKPIHQNRLLEAILATVTETRMEVVVAKPEPPPRAPARALRILLAEDNPHNQRVAVLILAKSGHAVTVVSNGLEAVEALKRGPYDLVLMDLQMPMMDGLQATAAIRAAEAGTSRRVPIIALTAHAMKEDEDRCLAAGMDQYLSKPIHEEKLLKLIGECMALENRAAVREAERDEPSQPTGPMDVAAALDLVNGDRVFFAEMAEMFLVESRKLRAQIRDALAIGDLAALVAPVHSLKNWLGNFVALAAYDSLSRLEAMGRAGHLNETRALLANLESEFDRLMPVVAQIPLGAAGAQVTSAVLPDRKGQRSPTCIR